MMNRGKDKTSLSRISPTLTTLITVMATLLSNSAYGGGWAGSGGDIMVALDRWQCQVAWHDGSTVRNDQFKIAIPRRAWRENRENQPPYDFTRAEASLSTPKDAAARYVKITLEYIHATRLGDDGEQQAALWLRFAPTLHEPHTTGSEAIGQPDLWRAFDPSSHDWQAVAIVNKIPGFKQRAFATTVKSLRDPAVYAHVSCHVERID